jgi:hypothetical protein
MSIQLPLICRGWVHVRLSADILLLVEAVPTALRGLLAAHQ